MRGHGDDSTYKPNLAFKFNTPKNITKVVQLGRDNDGPSRIQLGTTTFTHPLTDSGPGTVIYTTGSSSINPIYNEVNGSWIGITDLISYRD